MKHFLCIFSFITFVNMPSLLYGANALDMLPYNESFDGAEVELLISYKMISYNHLPQGEAYRVSHVMNYQASKGYRVVRVCEIDASRYPLMDDMPYFITSVLKLEKEQVLECLLGHEVYIRESASGRNNALSSKMRLEIPSTRVLAKLLNKSIMVYILSKEQT